MLGYIGSSMNRARRRRFARQTESSVPAALCHREQGFEIAVVPPVGQGSDATLRAELLIDPHHVLAFEGYLLDEEIGSAKETAAWLLASYARRGLTAFEALNGAYSICLYDRRERRAWLTACAFGRRDLYYLRDGDDLLFASDLHRLLALALAPPALAHDQLTSSFLCGAMHGGATLIRGVRRAIPGAIVRAHVDSGDLHELPPAPLSALPEEGEPRDTIQDDAQAVALLDETLQGAVARLTRVTRRRAVMTSAGVDSTLVAAVVANVTGELDAVTLGMPAPPDESAAAEAIVRVLGGTHHVGRFIPGQADPIVDMRTFVAILEDPAWFGLGMAIMTLVRSARERADGFVVGVGGDTVFGDPLHGAHDPSPESIFHYVFRMIDLDCVSDIVELQGPHPDAIVGELRARLSRDPARHDLHLPLITQSGLMIRFASRLARFHGAEALFPYLDRRMVDLALRLPPALRTAEKPLLRALASRKYPPALQQTEKVPFAAFPIDWLHAAGALDPLLDLLTDARTRERGLYRADGLRRLAESYRRGTPERRWNFVLWQVLVFELFCRRFIDGEGLED